MSWSRAPKVRVIQQMEAAECGLACLAMMLDHLGSPVSLAELRTVCGSSRDGNTAFDLLRGARQYGLEGRAVRVTLPAVSRLRVPAILHWNRSHFVVYEGGTSGELTVVDPSSGRRCVSTEEANSALSGVALELWPGDSFKKRKRKSLSYGRYLAALMQHKSSLAFVLLASVTGQVLALVAPVANQVLVDHVVLPARMQWLVPMLAVMLFAAVASLVLSRLQGVSQALLNAALGIRLSRDMTEHMLRLPLPFLHSRSHGDLISRVQLSGSLQGLIAATAKTGIDFVFVLAVILLMLAYDPLLGGLSLGLTLLRVLLLRVLRRPMAQRAAAGIAAGAREKSALVEAVSLLEMTKGFGVETALGERYARRAAERARWDIGSARLGLAIGSAMTVISSIMQALIFWAGGIKVVSGEMSLGVFTGFLAIRGMLEAPLGAIVGLVEGWLQVQGILERCDDILGMGQCESGDLRPTQFEGRIDLRNVGFRYGSGGPWVLREVNLTIESGEHVALVGPSGQGKSTLAQLICGLLEPSEGCVLLDGVDVREYDRGALARHMGVVLQVPVIFEGSLLQALRLRNPEAGPYAVQEAARLACFEEVVERMPGRYEAQLVSMGANLSGGERQRLALAQALLERPALLVLDEATCALDAEVERSVLSNLSSTGSTIVSVAHRDAVIAHAERIFRVTRGQVQEVTGTERSRVRASSGALSRERAHKPDTQEEELSW